MTSRLAVLLLAIAVFPGTGRAQPTPRTASGSGSLAELSSPILRTLKADGPAKALEAMGELTAQAESDPFLQRLSPAAAGVYRSLAQLSSDEQYEILSAWTLPKDETAVRVLTAIVPEIAPPMEFARALGERPKKESFAVASVGEVRGLFCSAWMLVVAADDSGQLRKLMAELEARAAKGTPNAAFVLTLARLRDSRSLIVELQTSLKSRAESDAPEMSVRMEDAVVLAAALQRTELSEVCESLAEKVTRFNFTTEAPAWMPFMRRLRALAILKCRSPDLDPAAILKETSPLWIAVSDQRHRGLATGSDQALWLTHENHVQRLSGPGDDLLLFRYPLTGKFELKGEVSVFDHGVAGMTFGGLTFDANDKLFTVRDAMRPAQESRTWPFVASKELRLFNRLNIRSDGERVLFLSNLHPGTSLAVPSCETSPWLGLQASGFGRAYFRNLEIVGEPVIPREVTLVKTSDLLGWMAPLGESLPKAAQPLIVLPSPATAEVPALASPTDWSVSNDEELVSHIVEAPIETAQRQLTWMRPLLEGETLHYEYFYEEHNADVHPTLGRMAFLLEPSGVRIRWITNGSTDWTGLEPDNAVIEPLNRKGPRTLPLKPQDWNAITLQLRDGKLQLALNGETIYVRPVVDLSSHHPGFIHNPHQTSARIRKVTLTGGTSWPATLTPEQMAHPVR